jgi:peptide/nickel transport system substrate-binding protein
MKARNWFLDIGVGIALAAASALCSAVTLKVANVGDPVSMDPHSLNETMQLSFTGNIYEPLVARDRNLALVPGLAMSWRRQQPTKWLFTLRKDVSFHDGTPLTADDVVFSFSRARSEGSDLLSMVSAIKEVRKVDELSVEIETNAPFSILPDVITQVYIMSRRWCEQNKAERPVDRRKGVENTASFKANGTGPFRLKERQPGTRTVLIRNASYWGKVDGNVDEVVFTPIAADATRVAAILSGEIDLMEPAPLQDIERLKADPKLKVLQGPEMRTVFLGMDQKRDQLLHSDVKGRNPFKDKRVRQAFYQAIDVETIKARVMRGAATPTALMVAPGVRGFDAALNKRLPYDPEAAKKLLAEAGYPNGFEVGLNCPNDRYVNDSAVCQAVAANLARVGVKVNLMVESKTTYFPKVLRRDTSFYLLAWTPNTYDAHNVLVSLIATPGGSQGQFNLGHYSNPKLDELIARVQSEINPEARQAAIHEAFRLHQDDVGHIPLHQQALAWVAKKNIELAQPADNFMPFKYVVVK